MPSSVRNPSAFDQGFSAAFDGEDELMSNPFPSDSDDHLSFNDGYQNFHDQEASRRERDNAARKFTSADPLLARLRSMTPQQVADLIGHPLSDWPGNCFAVASAIVTSLAWSDAEAVYGLYLGPVSRDCEMFRGRSAVRHGWILTREGVIVDPTAWVFAAAKPAIRISQPGDDDYLTVEPQYDEGAESVSTMVHVPFPLADICDVLHPLFGYELKTAIKNVLMTQGLFCVDDYLTAPQISWLCKVPYTRWGAAIATQLYKFADKHKCSACVPLDFRRRQEREQRWSQPAG